MKRDKLLVVIDPLPTGFSVQFKFVSSLIKELSVRYQVTVYSNFISNKKIEALQSQNSTVILKKGNKLSDLVKNVFFKKLNESLLWGINWFLDIISYKVKKNQIQTFSEGYDYIINLSSTIICKSDMLWFQGPPFINVVQSMVSTNMFARLFLKLFRLPLGNSSKFLTNMLVSSSEKVVANSKYIADEYESIGIKVDDVIYSSNAFDNFIPIIKTRSTKYVLSYLGKETDIEALLKLSRQNIRITAFGSKIPPGMNIVKIKSFINYVGAVSEKELIRLYNEALFVAFPFTNEPFGWIPIEAMLCGKPVLTYNKQGPSETVINGITGWLVASQEEFITKAIELWHMDTINIEERNCVDRGHEFTIYNTISKLQKLIEGN